MTINEVFDEWQEALLRSNEEDYFYFKMNGCFHKAWPISMETVNNYADNEIAFEVKFKYDGISN